MGKLDVIDTAKNKRCMCQQMDAAVSIVSLHREGTFIGMCELSAVPITLWKLFVFPKYCIVLFLITDSEGV